MAQAGKGSGIPEGGFEDIGQFDRWIRAQPRGLAAVIAWRTVARIVPVWEISSQPSDLVAVLGFLCWARARSAFDGLWTYYSHSNRSKLIQAAHHYGATHEDEPVFSGVSLLASAGFALTSMGDEARISGIFHPVTLAVRAANEAVSHLDEPPELWTQITLDGLTSRSQTVVDMCWLPLWRQDGQHGGVSYWARDPARSIRLLGQKFPKDHWEVWSDWYDKFSVGAGPRPQARMTEFARLRGIPDEIEISDEDWESGPVVVNPKIRQVLDWFEKQAAGAVSERAENLENQEVVIPTISTKRLPAIRLSIESLKAQVARDLDEHIAAKPNQEEKLVDWQAEYDLLEQVSSKLDRLANTIDQSDPQEPRAKAVEGVLAELAQEFESWIVTHKPELVDAVIRLPIAAGLLGLFNLVGATMPVATVAILAFVGGDKMVRLYKQMAGKAEKRDD